MGGGSGMFGNSLVRMGTKLGGEMPSQSQAQPTASYTPITPNVYGSAFPSQQTQQAPQVSPIVQQMANRIAMQNAPFNTGLQNLYTQFNAPLLQGSVPRAQLMPMPQYGSQPGNPLAYRPDMSQAQAALSRVKPSVYKTDLDAARARIAELEAAQQAQAQEQRPGLGSFND
jgi:hypothetical protein